MKKPLYINSTQSSKEDRGAVSTTQSPTRSILKRLSARSLPCQS